MSHDQPPDDQLPPPPDVEEGWPWSFLLLVGAGAVYLIFRFVQLIAELF